MQSEQTSKTKQSLGEDTVESLLAECVTTGKGLPRGRAGANNPGVEDRRLLNPQLYENSSMSGSILEQHAFEGDQAFHNSRPPNYVIKHEKPEHRLMVMMKLRGKSNHEIAEAMGYTNATISQVLRQPWARLYMQQEMAREGRDGLHELLASSAEDSVWTLIEVRDNPKSKGAEKIQASNSLLNRYLGNPTQAIVHSGKTNLSNIDDEQLIKIATAGGGDLTVKT